MHMQLQLINRIIYKYITVMKIYYYNKYDQHAGNFSFLTNILSCLIHANDYRYR